MVNMDTQKYSFNDWWDKWGKVMASIFHKISI